MLAELRRVRLNHAYTKLVEVRTVCFEYRKACMRVLEIRRVRIDYNKVCMKLAEVWKVGFDNRKACIVGLEKLGEPVLITSQRIRSL